MRTLFFAALLGLGAAQTALAGDFALASPDIDPRRPIANKYVFNGFGCVGENISPAVVWMDAPKDTKSFALTVYDPDAPTGSGWWHWLMVNIPADMHGLQQGAGDPAAGKAPKGALQVRTDFGKPGWGGPCPPQGDKAHRYVFTLHALKVEKLDLPADATAALAGFMINANRIASASFTGRYGRKQMDCRPGCGACCIAPSISSLAKPAGVPCRHLTGDRRCAIFADPHRPGCCAGLQPSAEMCGTDRDQALGWLARLELLTA